MFSSVVVITLLLVAAATEEACEKSVDYYENAGHYDVVWGEDNLHFGYYPHLEVGATTGVRLTHVQAARELTERMMRMAGVNEKSKVLDLGAGKGRACVEIAEMSGASCTGVDLTPGNIDRANELKKAHPELKLSYYVGSFTSLPSEVLKEKYDVVMSQVAFCHAHPQLPTIFREATKVMSSTSILLVNDFIGNNDGDFQEDTKRYVFKRLHFETLWGPRAWLDAAWAAGLKIYEYHSLDKHGELAYRDMSDEAYKRQLNTSDGTPLGLAYQRTADAVAYHDLGMNLVLFTL